MEAPEKVQLHAERGHLAVGAIGYTDTFDEAAANAVTDILHAAAARGHNPQAVLDRAAAYYAEEVAAPGRPPICDAPNPRTGWRCTLPTGEGHAAYGPGRHLTVIDGERYDWIE